MREKIIEYGGKVLFDTRVDDILVKNNEVQGVVTQHADHNCTQTKLFWQPDIRPAIFSNCSTARKSKSKPSLLRSGVRAEHPQELIDKIQYSCDYRGEFLPPAPYSIVKQVNGRGMYSFCMCPGGVIAPCATSSGRSRDQRMVAVKTRSGHCKLGHCRRTQT